MRFTSLILALTMTVALPSAAFAGGTGLDDSAPKKEKLFGDYNAADKNADTAISEEEWEAYLETHKTADAPRFDQIDSDNNKRIDEAEWKKQHDKEMSQKG
ncbi:MAG: hypothetical protein ACPW61_08695 [Methyloligella sp. ZOD6]